MKKMTVLSIIVLLVATGLSQVAVRADIPVKFVGQWGGPCNATAVSGNLLYMGIGPSLLIMDVSQPSNPIRLGQVILPGMAAGVAVSGN